jgi:hypothetical protein
MFYILRHGTKYITALCQNPKAKSTAWSAEGLGASQRASKRKENQAWSQKKQNKRNYFVLLFTFYRAFGRFRARAVQKPPKTNYEKPVGN